MILWKVCFNDATLYRQLPEKLISIFLRKRTYEKSFYNSCPVSAFYYSLCR